MPSPETRKPTPAQRRGLEAIRDSHDGFAFVGGMRTRLTPAGDAFVRFDVRCWLAERGWAERGGPGLHTIVLTPEGRALVEGGSS